MGVVKYTSRMGRNKKGICSNYLAKCNINEDITMRIKSRRTRLPKESTTPIIMVGPGTGCAIFRSMLQHRYFLKQQGMDVAPSLLFFGCRHQHKDYLHSQEWLDYVNAGLLLFFDPAFSRDQSNKVYVQHKIVQYSKQVAQLLKNNAVIYVSGYLYSIILS